VQWLCEQNAPAADRRRLKRAERALKIWFRVQGAP